MKLINKENTTLILLVIILVLCLILYRVNKEAFFDIKNTSKCLTDTNCHNELDDILKRCPDVFKKYVIQY